MRRKLALITVAVAGVLLLGACGTTDVGAGEPPALDDDAASHGRGLADGSHFGFLTDVDTTTGTITFDDAVWVPTDDEPNGYRIDDPEDTAVVVPIAEGAAIEVLLSTGDPATAAVVDTDGLADWFTGPAAGQELAFDLEVVDGAVESLRFVYRP